MPKQTVYGKLNLIFYYFDILLLNKLHPHANFIVILLFTKLMNTLPIDQQSGHIGKSILTH